MGLITFLITVTLLVAIQFGAFFALQFAWNKGAITLAITKILAVCALGLVTLLFILLSLPWADGPGDVFSPILKLFLIPALVVYGVYWVIEEVRESQLFQDAFRQGRGGAGRFAGEAAFRKNEMPDGWAKLENQPKREARMFLGRSKRRFDSTPRNVGLLDDSHMITFGMAGGGKSTHVLFNNLSQWSGSGLFCLDPKGELANTTIDARLLFHPRRRILDPFGVRDLIDRYDDLKVHYNPLAEIDINSPKATTLINAVAEGCTIASDGDNKFWTDGSQTVLGGVIAHVLSTEPKALHHLPYVSHILTTGNAEDFAMLLARMEQNTALGGLPAKAAAVVMRAGEKERGIYLNEIQRSLRWASEPNMAKHLMGNDCSLRELSDGQGASFYVCLPFDQMNDAGSIRWMRVLTRLGLVLTQHAEVKPDPPILFVLDEFPALGAFHSVKKDFRELRGAGIKMHILAQDAAAMLDLYGPSWISFAGSSTTQVIGINCTETAKWISQRLGQFMISQETGYLTGRPMMDEAEVLAFLGKSSGNQIVIPPDGHPWQLSSVNYFDSPHAYRKPQS